MTNNRIKALILLAVVLLLGNAIFLRHATFEMNDALLREKINDAVAFVDMLGAAVDANIERPWLQHEMNIRNSVEYMDGMYQVFAAAYEQTDGGLMLTTHRDFETSIFEPLDYPEFTAAIAKNDSGHLVIGYTPERQEYRNLHLYFRWMPLYSDWPHRYLVVAGVTNLSVATSIADWVTFGWVASMGVYFLVLLAVVIVVARVGYVYDHRSGADKWRKEGA
jgi:hypothetical protein